MEKQEADYKSRFSIQRSIVMKVKRSGYEVEEALEYFPNLIKIQQQNEINKQEANNKEAYYASTIAKISNEFIKLQTENRKLRKAITHLHPNDYWEVIKKAERGYYSYIEDKKDGVSE